MQILTILQSLLSLVSDVAKPYFQGHDAECKAIGATCNECFKTGHFQDSVWQSWQAS